MRYQFKISITLLVMLLFVISSCKTISFSNYTAHKQPYLFNAVILFNHPSGSNLTFSDLPGEVVALKCLITDQQQWFFLAKLAINNKAELVNIVNKLIVHGSEIRFAKLVNDLSESEISMMQLNHVEILD